MEKTYPISKIYRLRDSLSIKIDKKQWATSVMISKKILSLLPKAISETECGTGKPHIDGLYEIGYIRYSKAPKEASEILDHMNNEIKSARITLNKLNKKNKKKKKK